MMTSDGPRIRLFIATIVTAALLVLGSQGYGQATSYFEADGDKVRIRQGIRGKQVAARPAIGPCGLLGGAGNTAAVSTRGLACCLRPRVSISAR